MNQMYNQELKERFIKERAETVVLPGGYLNRWFKAIAEFEGLYRKDISNFTFYEIVDMYKTFNVNSIGVLNVLNSQLSIYTQWCLQQNLVLDSQNHFLELKKEIFAECINTSVINKKRVTREQVLEWARQLKNPSDSFLFLALFEGIRGQQFSELSFIKISDFHDGKVTLNSGREIEVSEELYNLALDANETLTYYGVTNDIVYPLNNEDLIIKNYHNTISVYDVAAAGQRIGNRIKRNTKYLGIEYLLANDLRESGRIDFIQRKSKLLKITAQEYIIEHTEEIEKQFDYKMRHPRLFYNENKEYLDE